MKEGKRQSDEVKSHTTGASLPGQGRPYMPLQDKQTNLERWTGKYFKKYGKALLSLAVSALFLYAAYYVGYKVGLKVAANPPKEAVVTPVREVWIDGRFRLIYNADKSYPNRQYYEAQKK
jgi:hypothetical protein